MIRYVVEKNIIHEYATGVMTLMDGNNPKTFSSQQEAKQWLVNNDDDYCRIPIVELADYYSIKPYII